MKKLPISENTLKSRDDLMQALRQILQPLKDLYSKEKSRLEIGHTSACYPSGISGMEGFARVLWGLVPYLAGGGEYDEFVNIYLEGLKNGTNPESGGYWGQIGPYDQRMVEMAALGLMLSLCPDKFWDPLSDKEKQNLYNWLDQINHHDMPKTNWLFFRVLVNLGFRKINMPYNDEAVKFAMDYIDKFYLGDGWYFDGYEKQIDYYIPFAMHFYGLIYAKLAESFDYDRCQKYKERAYEFAKDFKCWFSKDGSALPFGRSQTYRFAQSAFWAALAFADVEALPWGEIKGLLLRNLRWWFSQPIFDRDGILTIGYAYPNLIMAEGYNSPTSPYWALKSFLVLALLEEHPFWQAEEAPLSTPEKSVQKHARMIIERTKDSEQIQAFVSGQHSHEHAHADAKYEKFVYSNKFGFSVPKGNLNLKQGAYDNMLAVSLCDGRYRARYGCLDYKVFDDYTYSLWEPFRGVSVKSYIVPFCPWHVRIHIIDTQYEIDTAEGGFAIATEYNKKPMSYKKVKAEGPVAICEQEWGVSAICDVFGARKAEIIWPESNTNVLFSRSVLPTLTKRLEKGVHKLVCTVLGDTSKDREEHLDNPPEVIVGEDKVTIYYFDKVVNITL